MQQQKILHTSTITHNISVHFFETSLTATISDHLCSWAKIVPT